MRRESVNSKSAKVKTYEENCTAELRFYELIEWAPVLNVAADALVKGTNSPSRWLGVTIFQNAVWFPEPSIAICGLQSRIESAVALGIEKSRWRPSCSAIGGLRNHDTMIHGENTTEPIS